MVRMIIFVIYAGLNIILNIRLGTHPTYNGMETFKLKKVETLLHFVGIPWVLLMISGIYWGYFENPYHWKNLYYWEFPRISVWLEFITIFAIGISVILSYFVVWKSGWWNGYKEGRESERIYRMEEDFTFGDDEGL